MVQEFHVLRCFCCETFQVHQVKKSTKWTCRMCGEKQSIIKVFGGGSAPDCRRHTQQLNFLRGSSDEHKKSGCGSQYESERLHKDPCGEASSSREHTLEQSGKHIDYEGSRWKGYLPALATGGNGDTAFSEPTDDVTLDPNEWAGFRFSKRRRAQTLTQRNDKVTCNNKAETAPTMVCFTDDVSCQRDLSLQDIPKYNQGVKTRPWPRGQDSVPKQPHKTSKWLDFLGDASSNNQYSTTGTQILDTLEISAVKPVTGCVVAADSADPQTEAHHCIMPVKARCLVDQPNAIGEETVNKTAPVNLSLLTFFSTDDDFDETL